MVDDCPQADRILIAQLMEEARRHARWRELTGAEHDGAVAALRELANGRAGLGRRGWTGAAAASIASWMAGATCGQR